MSSTTTQKPSGEEDARTKEVAPPPPPGFEDVKAGAHLDEVAEVAEKLAKGENLGTKKEGTVDAPDASLKTGKLNWAEEVRRRRHRRRRRGFVAIVFFCPARSVSLSFSARACGSAMTTKNWRSDRMVFKDQGGGSSRKRRRRASIDERMWVFVLIFSLFAHALSLISHDTG